MRGRSHRGIVAAGSRGHHRFRENTVIPCTATVPGSWDRDPFPHSHRAKEPPCYCSEVKEVEMLRDERVVESIAGCVGVLGLMTTWTGYHRNRPLVLVRNNRL